MSGIDVLDEQDREKVSEAKADRWVDPQLAVLTDDPFSDPDWIYERKLDGVRLLAFARDGEVKLLTRNQKRRNGHFPEIVEGLEKWAAERDFIVDGEVVCFDGNLTSFSRLQQRVGVSNPEQARATGITIYFYVFDILNVDGYDVRELPLRTRKQLLRKTFSFGDRIRFSSHRNEKGKEWLEEACRKGWEGLIAKRADSTYASTRSKDWLKFKCVNQQELIIIGFTDPQGERKGFGALRVGYYEDDKLGNL